MRKKRLPKGLRKRIRLEKARLRRAGLAPEEFAQQLADIRRRLGVPLTAPHARVMGELTAEDR